MEAGIGGGAVGNGSSGANLSASVSGGNAADRRLSRGARPALATVPGTSQGSSSHLGRPPVTSASPTANSPSPTGGQTQHEVLQNFFQSLLSSKDRAGAAAGQTKSSPPKANGAGGGEEGAG